MPNPKISIIKGNTKSTIRKNNSNFLRKQTIKKQAIKTYIESPVIEINPPKLPNFIKKHIQDMKIKSESKKSPLSKSKQHLQVTKSNLTLKAKRLAKKKGRFLVKNFGFYIDKQPKQMKKSVSTSLLKVPNKTINSNRRPSKKNNLP